MIIIEDADRLTERAADALLKALEEPAPRTVWILCAPSLEDVIITIRSRSRHVRLRTPPVEAVAELLVRRDGIDPAMAHVRRPRRPEPRRPGPAAGPRRGRPHPAARRHRPGRAASAGSATPSTRRPTWRRSPTEESGGVLDRARRRRAGPAARDARRRPARPHPAAAHPLAGGRPGEGAEDAGDPVRPRRRRPVAGRPALGLPRRARRCTPAPRSPWSTRTWPTTSSGWPTMLGPEQLLQRDGRHRHGPRADRRQRRRRCWPSRRWRLAALPR